MYHASGTAHGGCGDHSVSTLTEVSAMSRGFGGVARYGGMLLMEGGEEVEVQEIEDEDNFRGARSSKRQRPIHRCACSPHLDLPKARTQSTDSTINTPTCVNATANYHIRSITWISSIPTHASSHSPETMVIRYTNTSKMAIAVSSEQQRQPPIDDPQH